MKLSAGSLDRRIRFERPVRTKDKTYGTSVTSWEPVATVWAQVQDILPSKGKDDTDEIVIAQRPARIRMRFRSDITPDMRVIYRDRTLEIVSGPVELGRRAGLELMVQEFSTAGDAP